MELISVNTGLGYFKDDQDRVICYANLPPGEHPIKTGYTYHEVNSQAELDAVEIYVDPAEQQATTNEQAIRQKLREMAITELTKVGQWPAQI